MFYNEKKLHLLEYKPRNKRDLNTYNQCCNSYVQYSLSQCFSIGKQNVWYVIPSLDSQEPS